MLYYSAYFTGFFIFILLSTLTGVMNLDWDNLPKISKIEIPDVVIGADIVYDPSILQPLCNVLQKLSVLNSQLEIYICSVIRNEVTINKFLECLGKQINLIFCTFYLL